MSPSRTRRFGWIGPAVEGSLPLLAGAVLWQAAGMLLVVPALPPLSDVLGHLIGLVRSGDLVVLGDSLAHLLVGLVLAFGGGFVTAGLLTMSRRAEALLLPYLNGAMSLPIVAFVPLFVLLFGFNDGPRIATIVAYSYFVVVVNTFAGARAVDPELVEMAHSMNAGPLRTFLMVRVPAALPMVLEGIAIGLARGLVGMVTGEYLVTAAGIGGQLVRYSQNYRLTDLYAAVVVVLAIAIAMHSLAVLAQRRLTFWNVGSLS